MTETCSVEGCQVNNEGECLEHKIEVERRKNMQKMVTQLKTSVERMDKHSKLVPRLHKMFVVTTTMSSLLLAGIALSLYAIAHVDQASRDRYELGMEAAESLRQDSSEINQQSINRDHLIIEMIENDRKMQSKLVGLVEGMQVRYDVTTEKLEAIHKEIDKLHGKD